MSVAPKSQSRNLLLNSLPARERKAIEKNATFVELPRPTQLELPNRRIEQLYFLENGIASIVAAGAHDGVQVEVGIIGREGVTGLPILHGNDRSPYSSYMQVGGSGYRIQADIIRNLMRHTVECRRIFLGFAQAFMLQTSETAVVNARGKIEERLARWLLMTRDRVDSDEIPLTHEFLSLMMGARRPGVTEATQALARKKLVATARGLITIVDRAGLEKIAGRYYGMPESEYRRLMSAKSKP